MKLIRDFFGSNARTYQSLTDTLAYFKKLGINAIELMPIMEFNGNESWGYNPTFLFAPDKAYGTINQLKTFIDRCHENGIAVIFDIAMNHHDAPNPYLLMDMDFTSFKPTSSNKWFNTEAKHPFNVFFDINHESSYTQHYLDTVNYYWLHEFNADGFRFDLSKGFTQTNNPSNINAWSNYDASRIALLKRMADKLWSHTPDAYIILEHFAANAEEKELAEYRASEGKGMLLWGNLNNAFSQQTKGISPDADISQAYYATRGWNVPHLITYMESHDEERLMYSNLTSGNASGSYTTRNLQTALKRMQAASLIFYAIPGPKMVWQFGEVGYDQSINRCADGSVSTTCRVDAKPVKWDYLANPDRYDLFELTADLIRLRNTYDIFTRGDADIQGMNSLSKQITLRNKPYHSSPLNASDMNVHVAGNFNLTSQSLSLTFPHTGKWYDYYSNGDEINVSTIPFPVTLPAGEYKLYTDVRIQNPLLITSVIENETSVIQCFPNPATDYIHLKPDNGTADLVLRTLHGVKIHPPKTSSDQWYIGDIAPGLYIAEIVMEQNIYRIKILIK
jgi:glycosidase